MKKISRFILSAALLFFALSGKGAAQNPGDVIFSGIQVHTIKISFPQPAYWDSLIVYYNAGLEQYLCATVTVNGTVYDSVGVRLKGNSSFAHPNNKKSFRLSFDQFKDHKWDSEKSIHLNNCWGDPSFMREKIHLDFCRDAGISAPRANFANLYINDTLWAFYSMVEHCDKRLLKTKFGTSTGDLFKAVDGIGEPGSGNELISDFLWYGSNDTNYTKRYEMKTDGSATAWPALISLLNAMNNNADTATTFEARVNLPAFYKAMAADNMFANLDAYVNSGRNFYFYFNPTTTKIDWIVWDMGLSFGAYQSGVTNVENMSVTYIRNPAARPLFARVLNNTTLKPAYLNAYYQMFKNYFTAARLFPHIDSMANIIRPHVAADPRKMYTAQQFELNISSDVTAAGGYGTRKPGLKSFINTRQTSLQNQFAALGITAVEHSAPETVNSFALMQNFPNPFNPSTVIVYSIGKSEHIKIEVVDLIGRTIATLVDEIKHEGIHSIRFNAGTITSGVYFYRLITPQAIFTKQIMILK